MANHKLTQKIFLSIIVVLLLSFAVPVRSQAGIGGILLDPLFDLVGTILDVFVGALQAFLVDGEFNNSEDSSGLNFYLADKDDFMSKIDDEYKEFKYTPDLKRPISIIDPETTEEVKPVLYFDGQTNEVKGKCKLKPFKSYFAFEIRDKREE